MVTMAKYHGYEWHPCGKNYEMDSIFFHLGEPWYLSVIIDEYCGATLSIGELGMRNVVSLHCDSEREVPHGSHGFHGFYLRNISLSWKFLGISFAVSKEKCKFATKCRMF